MIQYLIMAAIAAVIPAPHVVSGDQVNSIPSWQLKGMYKALTGYSPPGGADDNELRRRILETCQAGGISILPDAR